MSETATSTPPRYIEYRRPEDVQGAPVNPKEHDQAGIRASIKRLGFTEAPFLDERTGRLIAGHGRIDELIAMEVEGEPVPDGIVLDAEGRWTMPIQRGWASADDVEAEIALLGSNMLVEAGGWDEVQRAEMLRRISDRDEEILRSVGFDRAGMDRLLAGLAAPSGTPEVERPSLRDRFLVPPFDVLDARQGWWQERKRQWIALGIRSELGRSALAPGMDQPRRPTSAWLGTSGADDEAINNPKSGRRYESKPDALLMKSDTGRDPAYYTKKRAVEARLGRELSTEEYQRDYYVPGGDASSISDSGTSIFDPVLCELAYRWYSAPGDTVLDPFAGGSVRGIIAALLGRRYLGVDLSAEQIAANDAQVEAIVGPPTDDRGTVRYELGDCRDVLAAQPDESADLVLTCPPYLSLERYSDDPRDLSTMPVREFTRAVQDVCAATFRVLRPNTFAVWVVGQVRLPGGKGQVDLRAVVETAATAAGFVLHNAAVLVTPVGSLAVRAPRAFQGTRVLGRGYQDVVVLLKGDARAAVERLGEVYVPDLDALSVGDTPGE